MDGFTNMTRMSFLVLATLVLVSAVPVSAAGNEVGSSFPPNSEAGGSLKGLSTEDLVSRLGEAPKGSPAADELLLTLAARGSGDTRPVEAALASCDSDQVLRVARKADASRDLRAVRALGDEVLRRTHDSSEVADVVVATAKAHMVLDTDSNRALMLWAGLGSTPGDSVEKKAAAIYREAVLGPKSIAALEAAHELGRLQQEVGGSGGIRWQFSAHRVLEAAEKPFFQDYVTDPNISNQNKAEILHVVLWNARGADQPERVRALAARIFGLVGPDDRSYEQAAYAYATSFLAERNYGEAVMRLEEFVRMYPNAVTAPDACLWIGKACQTLGNIEDALVYYAVTNKAYPSSEAAAVARRLTAVLMATDPIAKDLAKVPVNSDAALARLRQPLEPAGPWKGTPPTQIAARKDGASSATVARGVPAAPDIRAEHMRLADAIQPGKGGN